MEADFSLKPSERLKKSSQFRKVYNGGRPLQAGAFKVIILENNLPYNRIGLSIAARRIALAVDRNRVKRALKEVFRLSKPILRSGFDIVVVAGAGAKKLKFNETRDGILELFNKLGLLRRK